MSTRSRIGIRNEDGSYTTIYCHMDGYLEGVGYTLYDHYRSEAKIKQLLDLGDIRYLEDAVSPPVGVRHSYEVPLEGVTVAYGRDRGEDKTEAQSASNIEELQLQSGTCLAAFTYIWHDGHWTWTNDFKEWHDLKAEQ